MCLDLFVVEVHGDDVGEAGVHQHLGHQLARYGAPAEPLAWQKFYFNAWI